MQKITSQNDLKSAIVQLEQKHHLEGIKLKEQFRLAYDSIKPAHILLNTLKEVGGSKELKSTLLNASVGMGTVFISKKIAQGFIYNPIRKLIGSALLFGITNVAVKNPDMIISIGKKFFDMLNRPKEVNIHEAVDPENNWRQ